MKLKYYLRGLAMGLVIATLILTIANRNNKPLTDAQIRQRAAELGMVDGESLKLSSLQGSTATESTSESSTQESSTAETAATATESTSESSTQESSAAETAATATESTSESSAQESSQAATATTATESASESSTQESSQAATATTATESASGSSAQESSASASGNNATDGGQAVTITIYSGATSYTVSKDLAAAGLVEDAKAYDKYLCDNGYASRIRVGTYQILPGSDEETIAKTIAR